MATYLYETIPTSENEEPTRFEFKQSMNDAAYTKHPETGVPIRRIIVGGYGLVTKANPQRPSAKPSSGGCCGGSCGCHH